MRKKMKQICCILLSLIMCFGMSTPTMAASSKYKAAVASYRQLIGQSGGDYKIVDLDGNGVPELVVYNSSKWANEVYTYNVNTGKKKCLKSVGVGKGYNMRAQYFKKKHQVALPTANTGGNSLYIYKIKGQSATKSLEAEYLNGRYGRFDPAYRQGYKINGKRVSYATYKKKVSSALKGFTSIG